MGARSRRNVAIISNYAETLGMDLVRGAVAYAVEVGNWELVSRTSLPAELSLDHFEEDAPAHVDGVVGQIYSEEALQRLRRRVKHVVNVSNRFGHISAPRVSPDDIAIGRLGAQHFLERGFQNFGFIGIPGHWYSERRGAAFVDEVKRAGRSVHVFFEPQTPALSPEENLHHVAEWLKSLPRPVAIMGCNDHRARHTLRVAETIGLQVPEEVAVIGVDRDEWAATRVSVPLSSVDPAPWRVGYEAARLLDRLMNGEPPPSAPIAVPPVGVVARRSSDAHKVGDALVISASQYIRRHTDRALTVQEVVDHVGCSRRLLETRFRVHLGCTPQDAIWRSHVERAKQLLEEGNLPAKVVAMRSGFSSPERLSVIFRRYTGRSPTAFRKEVQRVV